MKYKVGDKVKIREDLVEGGVYGGDSVTDNMTKYIGKDVIITYADEVYNIRETGTYNWTEEMIECLASELENTNKKEYYNRETVTIFTYFEGIQYFSEDNSTIGELLFRKYDIPQTTEKIIQNKNATIVILDDGSKGVAKCNADDEYDAVKGIEIARLRAEIKSATKKLKKIVK